MATVKKTITVTEKQDDWIKSQVQSGNYVNESDYIRELLRKDKEGQAYFKETKAAIDYGLKSGESEKSLDDIWAVAESVEKDENR